MIRRRRWIANASSFLERLDERLRGRQVFWLGRASRETRVARLAFPASSASGCLSARRANALTAAGPHRICTGFPRPLRGGYCSTPPRAPACRRYPSPVVRIALACALYLAVVLAWAAVRLDDGSSPSMTTGWAIAVVGVHVLAGGIAPRWPLLGLPLVAAALAVPLGGPSHGEVAAALVMLYWAPVAMVLIAVGIAAVRYVPPLLRTRQV